MKTMTATAVRRGFLKILDALKPGEVIVITLRGKPVAQLVGLAEQG